MKKSAFVLGICCLFSLPLFAQDWNLVLAGSKYNFQINGASFVTNTIWVDGASALGADSVFWLSPKKGVTFSSSPYVGLVGNILGDTIVKHPGSVYECRFKPITDFTYPQVNTILHTKANIGASWEYKPGVTATVTEQKDTLCWGLPDSIKTISLSDGKVIRLSKNFGVVYLESQTLIGLEGQDIGVQLPVLGDFYQDWVTGAIFEQYGTSNSNYNLTGKSWTKYHVLGKTATADSIKINVRKLMRREQYVAAQLDTTIFEDKVEIYTILNPQYVYYPGTVKESFSNSFVTTAYQNTAEGLQLSVYTVTTPSSSGPVRSATFVMGIGETANTFSSNFLGSYYTSSLTLLGYQKAGQTQSGQLHPDSFFGVVTSSQEIDEFEQLTVFPNPAGSVIFIQCDDCPQAETAEWMDLSGKVVKTVQNPVFQSPIEVNDLPKGLYLLRIRMAGNYTAVRRVVVF